MADMYGTLVDANLFFESRLHTFSWDQANMTERQKALYHAANLIDQFDFIGDKYPVAILDDPTDEEKRTAELSQELAFPRGKVNEVPEEIKRAGYLIAKALLDGREPDLDLESLATTKQEYGGVKTAYKRDGNTLEHLASLIPSAEAFNLMRPFFRHRTQFTVKRV
jgi:hypothetical protein